MVEHISELPFEILIHIFSFLSTSELVATDWGYKTFTVYLQSRVGYVCRTWNNFVQDDKVWEEAFAKYWGRQPDM